MNVAMEKGKMMSEDIEESEEYISGYGNGARAVRDSTKDKLKALTEERDSWRKLATLWERIATNHTLYYNTPRNMEDEEKRDD